MPLIHAYRIVNGDRIKGTMALVDKTEILSENEVEIYFKNGVSKTFRHDQILTVSNRNGAIRPKYKQNHRM